MWLSIFLFRKKRDNKTKLTNNERMLELFECKCIVNDYRMQNNTKYCTVMLI